jgi:phosphotransferase system HPr (HPr) family protein
MIERTVTVSNSLGIHARPASMIVQAAGRYRADVSLEKDGTRADAKSIMNVMMLAASRGSQVTIRADGADEDEAVNAIARLFEDKFSEE